MSSMFRAPVRRCKLALVAKGTLDSMTMEELRITARNISLTLLIRTLRKSEFPEAPEDAINISAPTLHARVFSTRQTDGDWTNTCLDLVGPGRSEWPRYYVDDGSRDPEVTRLLDLDAEDFDR